MANKSIIIIIVIFRQVLATKVSNSCPYLLTTDIVIKDDKLKKKKGEKVDPPTHTTSHLGGLGSIGCSSDPHFEPSPN